MKEEMEALKQRNRLTVLEGDALRASVLRELRTQAAPAPGPPAAFSSRRWAMAAAAMLVLAAGFGAGRLSAPVQPAIDTSLAGVIRQASLDPRTISDIENSPYMFTNVTFRTVDDAQVGIGFDVSTHVDLVARKDDPLLRELVVQAVLNPSPVGSRLKAISYAGGPRDEELIGALRIAMLSDPSDAVRLRALEALAPYKSEPDIQSALLMVLATAESAPMRLRAVDYLVGGQADKEAMRTALARLAPIDRSVALVKAGAYLR